MTRKRKAKVSGDLGSGSGSELQQQSSSTNSDSNKTSQVNTGSNSGSQSDSRENSSSKSNDSNSKTDTGGSSNKRKNSNSKSSRNDQTKTDGSGVSKIGTSKFGGFSGTGISESPWALEVDISEVELPDQTIIPAFYVRNLCFTPSGIPGSDCYMDFFNSTYPEIYQVSQSYSNMSRVLQPDEVWIYLCGVTYALSLVNVLLKVEQILLTRNHELAGSNFISVLNISMSNEVFTEAHRLARILESFRLPPRLVNIIRELFSPTFLSGTKFVAWFLPLCPNSVIKPIKFNDRNSIMDTLAQTNMMLSGTVFRTVNSFFMRCNLYNPIAEFRPNGIVATSPSLENIWLNSGRLYKDENITRLYFKTSFDLKEEFVYHSVLSETSVDSLSMLHIDISRDEGRNNKLIFSKIVDREHPIGFDFQNTIPDTLRPFCSRVNVFYGRIGFPDMYNIVDYSPRAIFILNGGLIDEVIFNQTFIWPSRVRDLFQDSITSSGIPSFLGYRPVSSVRTFRISLVVLRRQLLRATSDIFKNVTPVSVNKTNDAHFQP